MLDAVPPIYRKTIGNTGTDAPGATTKRANTAAPASRSCPKACSSRGNSNSGECATWRALRGRRHRAESCDQEQPCSNCLRRFPVPLCEYRTGNRIPGTSTFLAPARAGGRAHLHPPLPGVNLPLAQASHSPRTAGHSHISVAGWAVSEDTTSHSSPGTDCSTDPSVSDTLCTASAPVNESKRTAAAVVAPAPWFPLADPQRSALDSDVSQASQQVLAYRLAVPGLVLNLIDKGGIGEHEGDDNNDDDNKLLVADEPIPQNWHYAEEPGVQRPERPISGVDDDLVHLPVAQTVLNKKLLRIYVAVLSRFKASLDGDPDLNNPFIRHYSPFCLRDPLVVQIILYTSACFLHETGHVRTTALRTLKGRAIHMLNESLRSHDADGRRRSRSRDAAKTALATTMTTESSGRSEHPSDAAIAGVIQLTITEWYWGETEDDLRYHLRGLRGMIRLRGGFNQLGLNGLLAKTAIAHDVSISLAHENIPTLLTPPPSDIGRAGGDGSQGIQTHARHSQGAPATASDPWGSTGYAFVDPIKDVPFRTAHMSPFVSHLPSSVGVLPSFADCATSLSIHTATASILDSVRYLIGVVEAVYAVVNETNATTTSTTTPTWIQASRKAQLTGRYMHEHISGLHLTIPGFPQTSSPEEVSTKARPLLASIYHSAVTAAAIDKASVGSGSIFGTGTAGRGSVGVDRSPPGSASDSEWLRTAREASDSPGSSLSMQHGSHRQHVQQSPDLMYQVVRMTAIVYTRAIANGIPLSGACTGSEFLQIWTTMWRVPLSTWNGAVGVFHWIMLAIAPACHHTPHARFVKNMTTISTLTLGVGNWAMAMGAARAAMRLQHWLGSLQDTKGTDERDGAGAGAAASTAAKGAAGSAAGERGSGLEER
ncbi:hypothetical protein LY78DRAFT_699298 [Colletotrichum sublineola]|uniref:Transcription factor domain-containing protein n=1 Tax=Colletotrichum sublineola TaxID=1173701 RepID=A0A066XAY1_COLSU|nr:hypothetical protein LY78DRAFT_699298 [Colletotrichum sublineola]KDN66333.1 hypothetical protein CSUB01_03260 [Colletotrichum sublineola]